MVYGRMLSASWTGTMFKARKFKDLETRLGYRFKDQSLLERALTHSSLRGLEESARRQ
jgi:dsRNA-specific ribonuclease